MKREGRVESMGPGVAAGRGTSRENKAANDGISSGRNGTSRLLQIPSAASQAINRAALTSVPYAGGRGRLIGVCGCTGADCDVDVGSVGGVGVSAGRGSRNHQYARVQR